MIDKEQYQRTFGVLHASGDFLKEDFPMKQTKHFPARRLIFVCAAVILVFAMATVCYAANVGGIQRTVQIWIHGEQTTAVMDIQDGQYTLTYEDGDGVVHERGGGGVALGPFGSERPLTEEELMEHLDMPEVEYPEDGTVWLYYKGNSLEITDRFNEDGFCFAQLVDGDRTLYVTVKYQDGYAASHIDFVQPEEFG